MAPPPRIGTEFAGYRIEGLLGRGGMGVVYRAEHPRLGVAIALKVMDPEIAMDEGFRERFVREARAAARIRHPNIIPVYDVGEWHGDLFIAMRYVEGDDLGTLLGKEGPLTTEQTCVIGRQIANALDAAHRSGLLHRDVKPGNILVEADADTDTGLTAYLSDLGLTKQVDTHGGVTGSGELLGTLDYIAPEQIDGSPVDGRADVYALACVLFECLTGSRPYVRENQAALLWAHLHDEVPRASALNPSLPKSVDAALARGMAKSPEDRFPTGRELVEALQAPSEGSTVIRRDGAATKLTRGSAPDAPTVAASNGSRRGSRRAVVLGTALGIVLGGAAAAAVALLVSDDEPAGTRTVTEESPAGGTAETPVAASLTPFDRELLRHVPDELRESCRHAPPLSTDFDATVSCSPGGAVSSLTYSHARSGLLLHDQFMSSVSTAGLPASESGEDPTLAEVVQASTDLCAAGETPAVNAVVAQGLSGRAEVTEKIPLDERLGYVLCHRRFGQARIEWITLEVGVDAVATGEELGPLYEWWRKDGGPEP
jgi:serine/threonine-protein kinase